MQDLQLQLRLDVREEQHVRVPLALVELRLEIGEDVELRVARFGDVQVIAVLAAPEKCLRAGDALKSVEIDVAPLKHRRVVLREVVADDRHEIDLGEKRRGDGKIRRRSADAAVHFSERGLQSVKRDAADDEDAHFRYFPISGARCCFAVSGTTAGSVIMANCSAFTHAQSRLRSATRGIELRRMVWAMAAFARRYPRI